MGNIHPQNLNKHPNLARTPASHEWLCKFRTQMTEYLEVAGDDEADLHGRRSSSSRTNDGRTVNSPEPAVGRNGGGG